MPWSLRPAVPRDAERIATVLTEGFESYRSFAPPGWEPPDPQAELKRLRAFLGNGEVWCLVAEDGGEIAGHVAIMPSRIHSHPSDDDAMAHFWQLFVREPWWGTGVAAALHAEARARGGRTRVHVDAPVHARRPGARPALLRARGLDAGRRAVRRPGLRHAARGVPAGDQHQRVTEAGQPRA